MPHQTGGKLFLLTCLLLSSCTFSPSPPTPFFPAEDGGAQPQTVTPFLPYPIGLETPTQVPMPVDGSPPAPDLQEGPISSEMDTELPQPYVSTTTSETPAPGSSQTCIAGQDCPGPTWSSTPLPATLEAFYRRSVLLPIVEEIVSRVNQERAALGLPTLATPSGLMEIASIRSEDMVSRNYLGHQDPENGDALAWLLLVEAGYGGRLGENLIMIPGPLHEVASASVAAWMSSPEHRAVILDPQFRFTGVGLMGDGTWWRVTQVFAKNGPQ